MYYVCVIWTHIHLDVVFFLVHLLHLYWNLNRGFYLRMIFFMLMVPLPPAAHLLEKSGLGLKVHLLTDFPAFFLAVGSQLIKEPASAFKPWTNTDRHRLVHFIPVRVPTPLFTHTWPIIFERIRSHRGDPLVQLSLKLVAHPRKWCGQFVWAWAAKLPPLWIAPNMEMRALLIFFLLTFD